MCICGCVLEGCEREEGESRNKLSEGHGDIIGVGLTRLLCTECTSDSDGVVLTKYICVYVSALYG